MGSGLQEIDPRLIEAFRQCTARVLDSASELLGSSFFLSEGLLVTCEHVLPSANKAIFVQPYSADRPRPAEVVGVFGYPYPDLALLQVDIEAGSHIPLAGDVRFLDPLFTYGFTPDYFDGDPVLLRFEEFSGGRHALLKLREGQVESGMSGAPVLNLRTGGICGVLRRTRDRFADLGGRAIPIHEIESRITALTTDDQFRSWLTLLTADQQSQLLGRSRSRDKWGMLRKSVRNEQDRIGERRVAGSSWVQQRDLICDGGLLISVPWVADRDIWDESESLLVNLVSAVRDRESDKSTPVLVLAPPGSGKSTLIFALFDAMASFFCTGGSDRCPIAIDLAQYRYDQDCGTSEWLDTHFARLGYDAANPSHHVILVDSLDEFLTGRELDELQQLLTRPLFQECALLTCRTGFYDRFLDGSDFTSNFDILRLLPWADEQRSAYIDGYLALASERGIAIDRASGIDEHLLLLCEVPLQLNMILDLWLDPQARTSEVSDLLSLYQIFVNSWLRREALKAGSTLSHEEKHELLEHIAWHFHDEARVAGERAAPFTIGALRTLLGIEMKTDRRRTRALTDDLLHRSLLVLRRETLASAEDHSVEFSHRLFHEYFVATRLFAFLAREPERLIDAFGHFLSPEVSDFLKELLLRVQRQPRSRERIVANCITALEGLKGAPTQMRSHRVRIARQQLYYYLGNLRDDHAIDYVTARIDTERDRWVQRGMIIGLAFGGVSAPLDDYVSALRRERETGTMPPVLNEVNWGFHLSFFGDQPLDSRRPDVDRRLPDCGKTVRRLLYQLGTVTDRANWRLNLYTLVDLARHRSESRNDFDNTMREQLSVAKRIVEDLSADPEACGCVELAEFKQLLAEFDRRPGDSR